MSTLLQRTLSGAVYVAVIVGAILAPQSYFFAMIACLMAVLGIREFMHLTGKDTWLTAITGVTGVCLVLLFWLPDFIEKDMYLPGGNHDRAVNLITVAVVVIFLLSQFVALLAELFRQAENPIANWGRYWQAVIMTGIPFGCMAAMCENHKYCLLALFISVWVNDTGAYLVGMATARLPKGNHKMFVRVSPKKSWEGLIGGILFNLAAGYIFYRAGWIDQPGLAIVFVLFTSIFGTLGDLMESLMKRTVGVKDSGRFMPGHGGVLDRFDSMLLAAPAIALLIFLSEYLS